MQPLGWEWHRITQTWWRLVTFTCRLFAMSDNPLPVTLQIPWLAQSLALVWITVTLCFTACHEKTLISFSASRTVQHGLSVALVDGSKVQGSYVTAYTDCQFEQEPTSSWRHCATSHGRRVNLTIRLQNFALINNSSLSHHVRHHRNC